MGFECCASVPFVFSGNVTLYNEQGSFNDFEKFYFELDKFKIKLLKIINNSQRENKGNHYRERGLDM